MKSCKKIMTIFYIILLLIVFWNLITQMNKTNNVKRDSEKNSLLDSKIIRPSSDEKPPIHCETEDEFMKRITVRMRERAKRVQNICKRLGFSKSAFHSQQLLVAKRYNFLYCRIPKAGSTNMDRVISQLIKKSDYKIPTMSLILRDKSPHRVEKFAERNFTLAEIKNFLTFIIVRNPFVRLLSAYKKKVYNSGKNPKGRVDVPWLSYKEVPFNVSFADYVEHLLLRPGLYSTIEKHWSLYIDLCQPCHVEYKVIAHLETIAEDMRYFLTLIGAPRNISFGRGIGPGGSSETKSENIIPHYNSVKKAKIHKLYNLYKPDFDIFGFKLPKQIF